MNPNTTKTKWVFRFNQMALLAAVSMLQPLTHADPFEETGIFTKVAEITDLSSTGGGIGAFRIENYIYVTVLYFINSRIYSDSGDLVYEPEFGPGWKELLTIRSHKAFFLERSNDGIWILEVDLKTVPAKEKYLTGKISKPEEVYSSGVWFDNNFMETPVVNRPDWVQLLVIEDDDKVLVYDYTFKPRNDARWVWDYETGEWFYLAAIGNAFWRYTNNQWQRF